MSTDLENALAKIRPHTSSNLPHQKAPATLLHALEATLDEQKTERSPTAYFAGLLTTLDGTVQKERASGIGLGDGDMLPAELYLLALVAPFTPPPVIRGNLTTILALTSPLFPTLNEHAPPLRSQLGLYSPLLKALDRTQLDIQGVRQSFASILQLCLDPRPKVRRKAADVVKDVLSYPPSPLLQHPYADRVAGWVKSNLAEVASNVLPKVKHNKADMESAELAIHLLAFLRPVILKLPPSSLSALVPLLLSLPRLGNPFLSQSAYSILSDLLSTPPVEGEVDVIPEIPQILKAVLSSPPPKTDATLAPAWLSLLGNAMLAYKDAAPEASAAELGKVWKAVWTFLESSDSAIRKASSQSLELLAQSFTPTFVLPAVAEHGRAEAKSALGKIIIQTEKALDALAFARAMPELLSTLSALVANLRLRASPAAPTAAEVLLLPLMVKIAALRIEKDFEHKESADAVLGTAMTTMGPAVVLEAMPLNLEPSDRKAGLDPRAFLLPMLAQPHPSPLGHFLSYFVPLSERMFNLQEKAGEEGRASESKVWAVLIAQIWAGLPGYCWGCADLQVSFTPAFSQLLSQILYNQPELRPPVLRALKILVDSNTALASGDKTLIAKLPATCRLDGISADAASQNLAFLQAQAESWLAVLFNVFGSVSRDARGMVGDVISAWAGVAGEQAISQAYRKIVDIFKQNLVRPQQTRGPAEGGSVVAMTQDILLLVLPYLVPTDAAALFELSMSQEVLTNHDNGVQKRGYKTLCRLVESGKLGVAFDIEGVIKRLDAATEGIASAAKKDRLYLYAKLLPLIPSHALHIIPSLLPEAVLGTKEPSEKARSAAFELIVAMGHKMSEGGVVKRDLMDGMDEDEEMAGEAKASIEEYMTMIAAGLAGATPHMISATITAISRLVYEFRDSISLDMHTEIFSTILVFLKSANREIVKSALGFVKLAVTTLSEDLVRPQLSELVPALLGWSHDHKNHFKVKVRHIFERMVRRFGFQDVYACAGDEEAKKVLVNIKKRKDRAKKKRARAADEDDDEAPAPKKAVAGDAFEDVLYGSESELADSDDEEDESRTAKAGAVKHKGGEFSARLRMDDDQPMDLLSGAASRMTDAQKSRRRKPGQDASRFKTDDETGKMIIDDGSDSDAAPAGDAEAGAAYREAITSVDGFTRGRDGRVKFNKDTKKRRRDNAADDADVDVEMADADGGTQRKRRGSVKLGRDFKAKKAGGDIKKGGVDPFAYIPLGQAAKKGNKRDRIGVAGKR
ncbi:NUC173-domain-containing protein [Auriscalpium vulgare]|uniref:NUC173-domain-containing protein n=1 Tax=Auriscalpium vulgare TaxID=40419 RepID=A0ACB8S6U7_9AGAM|nr:NUC173-domain-containing protein [Auriscalpium vulgare]